MNDALWINECTLSLWQKRRPNCKLLQTECYGKESMNKCPWWNFFMLEDSQKQNAFYFALNPHLVLQKVLMQLGVYIVSLKLFHYSISTQCALTDSACLCSKTPFVYCVQSQNDNKYQKRSAKFPSNAERHSTITLLTDIKKQILTHISWICINTMHIHFNRGRVLNTAIRQTNIGEYGNMAIQITKWQYQVQTGCHNRYSECNV